jgi:hypothetical protein
MRRLKINHRSRLWMLALFVGTVLTACSLLSLAHSTESTNNSAQSACSSTCTSHFQSISSINLDNKLKKNDKEPTPPLLYWQQMEISLIAMYVAPVIVPIILYKRNIILQTSLLRI